MKVVMLTTVHLATDVRIFKEALTLRQAGYDSVIIGPHSRSESIQDVRIRSLPKWKMRSDRVWVAWQCFREARTERADAYHFHDPELLLVGLLLKWTTKARVVYDCHEYLALGIRQYKAWIPRPLRVPLSRLVGWIELATAKRIDGVVSVLEDMTERFGKVNKHVATVRNYALQVKQEDVVRPNIVPESIVYIGLLNEIRGLHTMIAAMRILAEVRPNAKCYVVGRVDGMETVQQDSIPSNLVFLGQRPPLEAMGYLHQARVAWLPLEMAEYNVRSLPNKLTEYLSAGKPVVASNIGRIGSIIREHECGLTPPPGSAKEHAMALAYLLGDEDTAAAYAARARDAFVKYFDWEQEKRALILFYKGLLGAL